MGMFHGEKYHEVSIDNSSRHYLEKQGGLPCTVELSDIDIQSEVDDFAQVTPLNMAFPIIIFILFALVAIMLQIVHDHKRRKGIETNIGRTSTLNLFVDAKKKNKRRTS